MEQMVRTIRILCVLVLLQACAYGRAMKTADGLAAAGDWNAAYAAYGEALAEKPDSEEAKAGRDEARDRSVDEALESAQAGLESGSYQQVADGLAHVESLDTDRPEVFTLRNELTAMMQADFEGKWAAQEPRPAYELAVLASQLVPKGGFLEEALPTCRAHFTAEAERLSAGGEHEEALVAVRTITDLEPDRKGDIAALEQSILVAWADETVRRAVGHAKARRVGAAAVLYARAYELAGRRDDIDKARSLASGLRDDGQLTLRLSTLGPVERRDSLEELLEKGLVGITALAQVDTSSSADLRVAVKVERAKCTESKEVTPRSKDYISGQIEVPNPVHQDLTAKREVAEEAEAAASAREVELAPDLEAAKAALASYDTQIASLEGEKKPTQSKLDMAMTQLKSNEARREELTAQRAQLAGTPGAEASVESIDTKLAALTTTLAEWQEQVDLHQGGVDDVQKKIDALQVERGPAASAVERLQGGYDAIVADRDAARKEFSTLSSTLASTSRTIWEDVHDTFTYDEEAWTRTCVAPVSAVATPGWPTSLDKRKAYAPEHTTTDVAHVGHEKAEVPVDDKAYPDTDRSLVMKGDEATGLELLTWMTALADEHFATRRTETLAALESKPMAATTDLVGLYVGARSRLDDEAVASFSAHVKSTFGLEKLELLEGAGTN